MRNNMKALSFLLILTFVSPGSAAGNKNTSELHRELLISSVESKAMAELERLLKKNRGTALEPELHVRKANLFLRKAKSSRFFEYKKEDLGGKQLVPGRFLKTSAAQWMREAAGLFDFIEKRFPNFYDLDAVLFQNGFTRQQLEDSSGAERKYLTLIAKFPRSDYLPEAHLALGEIFYDRRKFAEAIAHYEKVLGFADARIHSMALYKLAWSHYNRQDAGAALSRLEELLSWEKNSEPESGRLLTREALGDMALFFSESRSAGEAYAYFRRHAGEDCVRYLLKLGKLYRHHGRKKNAETVLVAAIQREKMTGWLAETFAELIAMYKESSEHENGFDYLRMFGERCVPSEDAAADECEKILMPLSLKVAIEWHDRWKKRPTENGEVPRYADAAYEIYLSRKGESPEKEKIRYQRAELVFALRDYRKAGRLYAEVAEKATDLSLLHDAPYAALVSLEKAVGDGKWSERDEAEFRRLTKLYARHNPRGKYRFDLLYKQAHISLGRGETESALSAFKILGDEKIDNEKVKLAQESYLDLLSELKRHGHVKTAAYEWLGGEKDPMRKKKLLAIHIEAKFAELQAEENSGDPFEVVRGYKNFARDHADHPLAEKAWWNAVVLLRKKSDFFAAAEMAAELPDRFQKSGLVIESISLAGRLYEEMGELEKTAKTLETLASMKKGKEGADGLFLAAEFHRLSGGWRNALGIYEKLLADPARQTDIFPRLLALPAIDEDVKKKKTAWLTRMRSHPSARIQAMAELEQAKTELEREDWGAAFRSAATVVGKSGVSAEEWAEARAIQARILAREYRQQSIKTTQIERIALVLSIKTEKLKKAQSAYDDVVKKARPELAAEALYEVGVLYQDYVQSLKDYPYPAGLKEEDRIALQKEFDALTLPLEDKAVETLDGARQLVEKFDIYSAVHRRIRRELRRLNFQPELPAVEMREPAILVPHWEPGVG